MCKIFTLTNGTKIKSWKKVTNLIARELQAYEQDGFGYSIQGDKGIFGERSIANTFRTSLDSPVLDFPFLKKSYNRYGTSGKCTGAAMFHGRTSTNDKTLLNTHPIIKHDWNLIHNGVVTNTGDKYSMLTSNDTEHLVHYMANHGITGVEKNLTGYYAFTAIDPQGRLHVVKDSTANLFFAEISTIDSFVFATKKELIEDICKEMKWKHSVIEELKDNTYLIYENNVLVSQTDIKPKGRTSYEDGFASRSLGRELNDYNYDTYGSEYFERPTVVKTPTDIIVRGKPAPVTDMDLETESMELFLEEMETLADHTYTFKSYQGYDLDINEFMLLDDEEKLNCIVIRPDGIVIDTLDYYNDKLYQGAI